MNSVRCFIAIVCAASLGALVLVVTVPPSGMPTVDSPPASSAECRPSTSIGHSGQTAGMPTRHFSGLAPLGGAQRRFNSSDSTFSNALIAPAVAITPQKIRNVTV